MYSFIPLLGSDTHGVSPAGRVDRVGSRKGAKLASFAHIAIIDDDEHVLNATGRLLAMQSFEVSKFTSAEAFLESPDLCNLSCVVTDLRLPGMHGTALLARLRELGCAVPLVFITAHPNDIARHAATGDAVCVLRKPFDSDQLMKCLERALAKRS